MSIFDFDLNREAYRDQISSTLQAVDIWAIHHVILPAFVGLVANVYGANQLGSVCVVFACAVWYEIATATLCVITSADDCKVSTVTCLWQDPLYAVFAAFLISPWLKNTVSTPLARGDLKWLVAFCFNFMQYIVLYDMQEDVAPMNRVVVTGIHWFTCFFMHQLQARGTFLKVYALCIGAVTLSVVLSFLTSGWWASTFLWVGITSLSVYAYWQTVQALLVIATLASFVQAWLAVLVYLIWLVSLYKTLPTHMTPNALVIYH